jgi:Flp pilus assembly protein TadG
MMHFLRPEVPRRGSIIPLFAILLIPLIGTLAFSIDLGYIALVKTDLQTAADAAALAGAEKLQALFVQFYSPGQTMQNTIIKNATTNVQGSPMATAEAFASYNKAGNVNIAVRDADVTFTYMDASGNFLSNYWAPGLTGGFPNSITVTTRRDSIKNTPVSLFFGPIFGMSNKELEATATATIYSGDVTSLQAIQGVTGVGAHILPVGLDMNVWKTFYTTSQSSDGLIHLAANGNPQLQVYPFGTNTPGNFGLLDTGPPANNVPAFRNWIDSGQTPNDISYLVNNGLLPVSVNSPKQWKVGPGINSTLQSSFASQIGVPNLIPLFEPVSALPPAVALSPGSYVAANGTGQGATYAIVGFVGVTITQADSSGTSMNISIQPAAVVDPTAVIGSPKPAGTQTSQLGSSSSITTFISAKLTQ